MQKRYSEEVIEALIEKIDILEFISQFVDMERQGNDWFGLCPLHREDTPSFSVNSDKNFFYCFGCGKGGTAIQFVQEYKKLSFNDSVKYLIDYVGGVNVIEEKSETMKFLKRINRVFKKSKEKIQHEILPFDIMNEYRKADIAEWEAEGIDQSVMDKYQVRYDDRANRIVYPIWDNKGNIINIKGRTLYKNFKELGIRKYTYYYPVEKADFLYGLYQKKKMIREANEVIVVEGVKSVYKLETWNINNAVSLETSCMSSYQLDILLNLKCDVVMALDKNVPLNIIRENTLKLRKFTNVSVLQDKEGFIGAKDAPVDNGLFTYLQLYEERVWI